MALFGLFSKEKKETLDKGLEKSNQSFFSKLGKAIVGKSTVDSDVLDELDERSAPVGVADGERVAVIDEDAAPRAAAGAWGGGWGARATGATGASSNGRRTVGGARRRGTRTDLGRRTETDRRGGRTSSWRSRVPTRARERNARPSRVLAAASGARVDTGAAVFEWLTLS